MGFFKNAVFSGETTILELDHHFDKVPELHDGNASHRLGDIIVMMIAASFLGANIANEYALFANTRMPLLNPLFSYYKGPSHDTFSRVFKFVDPDAFACSFELFAATFHQAMIVMFGCSGMANKTDGIALMASRSGGPMKKAMLPARQ